MKSVEDPVQYWVPAGKDSVPVTARVATTLKSRISEIVQSRELPFRTEAELVRAAVHHFVVEVLGPKLKDTGFAQDLRRQEALIMGARGLMRAHAAKVFIKEVNVTIQALQREVGCLDKAASIWIATEKTARESDDPFRSQVLDWLEKSDGIRDARVEAKRILSQHAMESQEEGEEG